MKELFVTPTVFDLLKKNTKEVKFPALNNSPSRKYRNVLLGGPIVRVIDIPGIEYPVGFERNQDKRKNKRIKAKLRKRMKRAYKASGIYLIDYEKLGKQIRE